MKDGLRILAVVPARSGSKGIPDKNLRQVGGLSLIARAARCLAECSEVDRRIISTDSPAYAEEARRHGLEVPFLRPPELSGDGVGAVETMQHAWIESERHYNERYDVLLIVEPTCPLRLPGDVQGCIDLLTASGADSVVTVSRVDTKFHPAKILRIDDGRLGFYLSEGAQVKTRQSLSAYYYRNGACYGLTRRALLERGEIFSDDTRAYVVDRPLPNIDEPIDLAWAGWLERGAPTDRAV